MSEAITLTQLKEILTVEGLEVAEQAETDQLYLVFKILEGEFPLFIKLCHDSELVQFLIFIPAKLIPQNIAASARLLHLLNKHIDLPGFCLDEESQVMFYRLMLPTYEKRVDKKLLMIYVQAVRSACEAFAALIQGVNQGAISLDTVMAQMNQKPKAS